MDLTDEDVRAILELLEKSAFGDLELETPELRLTLRRTPGGAWTRESTTLRAPDLLRPVSQTQPEFVKEATESSSTAAADPRPDLVDVRTPLPGTFYRSPKPGAPPFVELGMRVDADTVVAIVETMKLMNSVYAGVAGRVAEICVADASFAEQDAIILRIEAERP